MPTTTSSIAVRLGQPPQRDLVRVLDLRDVAGWPPASTSSVVAFSRTDDGGPSTLALDRAGTWLRYSPTTQQSAG